MGGLLEQLPIWLWQGQMGRPMASIPCPDKLRRNVKHITRSSRDSKKAVSILHPGCPGFYIAFRVLLLLRKTHKCSSDTALRDMRELVARHVLIQIRAEDEVPVTV